ncbi:helix-turn-helix domain-containing protein [Nitrospirales bacterium NOB]|nr:helix-turn-helix domain-containing protein [Nitrospirales bacterium NOB]
MLTVQEVSDWLNIKPGTLYSWAAKGKIPCRRMYGLVRFEREAIQTWLDTCHNIPQKPPALPIRHNNRDIDDVIEAAKREVYTPRHGETRPKSGLIQKEDADGADKT